MCASAFLQRRMDQVRAGAVELAVVFLAFGPHPGRQPSFSDPIMLSGADRRSRASKRRQSMEGGSQWQEAFNGGGRSTVEGSPQKGGKGGSPHKEAVDRRKWPSAGGVQQAAVAKKKKKERSDVKRACV